MEEKTINPFTDIPFADLPQNDPYTRYGSQELVSVAQMAIGNGSNVFRADEQGIWLGSSAYLAAQSTSFAVSMTGQLYATGATISGTITASSGTIGGFTIGATTLTGNGSGGDILTASSGERIEMRSSTKRVNFINASNHTTLSMHTGGTYTSALIAMSPQDDDRGCIAITTLSGNTKTVIDVASQGTGATMDIRQTNTSNTHDAVAVQSKGSGRAFSVDADYSSSTNHGAYFIARPDRTVTTDASVLYLDLSSSANGNGLYINDPTSQPLAFPLRINRAGNSGSDLFGAKIAVSNATGRAIGIDLASSGYAFAFAADATAAGSYAGRIPVIVGGLVRYIHYFNA